MNKEQTKNCENQNKTKKSINYLAIANKLLVGLILVAGVIYLGGTNDLAIKRFVVYKNKSKLDNLKNENRNLETKVMAMSSYGTINKKVASLKMVKTGKVDYINLNQAVAKR